jgi:hypothetical protein
MDKDYYYDIMDKLEELGFTAEYVLNAFVLSMSGDALHEEIEFFLRTHDIELEEVE